MNFFRNILKLIGKFSVPTVLQSWSDFRSKFEDKCKGHQISESHWLQMLGDTFEGKAAMELQHLKDTMGVNITYKKVVEILDKLLSGEGTTDGTEDLFNSRIQRSGESAGSYLEALKTLTMRAWSHQAETQGAKTPFNWCRE